MIGGDTELILQSITDAVEYDENGKRKSKYENVASLFGWPDLMTGDSKYDYKAKIEDSTHIFLCDYENLDTVDIENTKAIINGIEYEVKYIDDPMELHEHLEIYLKKIGGQ